MFISAALLFSFISHDVTLFIYPCNVISRWSHIKKKDFLLLRIQKQKKIFMLYKCLTHSFIFSLPFFHFISCLLIFLLNYCCGLCLFKSQSDSIIWSAHYSIAPHCQSRCQSMSIPSPHIPNIAPTQAIAHPYPHTHHSPLPTPQWPPLEEQCGATERPCSEHRWESVVIFNSQECVKCTLVEKRDAGGGTGSRTVSQLW